MSSNEKVWVTPVPRDEQVAALWLLFGGEPEAARRDRVVSSVRAATQGTVKFDHLLQACRGTSRVGVVWGQTLPGRNANIWPPYLAEGEPATTSDQLQHELDRRLAAAGFAMAQAMLPASADDVGKRLAIHNYRLVANLLYLTSDSEQFPAVCPTSELRFVPFEPAEQERLGAVIDASYAGSHDAPDMEGVRDIADVIAGYQATGQFAPDRWFFIQHAATDIGCLLQTRHVDLGIWELVYMGLIPAARGKGWGTEVVRFAQWKAGQAGVKSLLVSVDAANLPAVAAYRRCGFSELDRRQVWVKKFNAAQGSL